MRVKSLTSQANIKVTATIPVEKAWILLARRDISLVPVVSAENKLVGVIGEDDLLYRLVPDYFEYFSEYIPDSPNLKELEDKFEKEIILTAEDVMNKKAVTVSPDKPIFKALSKMMACQVRWLPVVDEDKKYLGMIGEDDIMQYLFTKHKNTVRKRIKSSLKKKPRYNNI